LSIVAVAEAGPSLFSANHKARFEARWVFLALVGLVQKVDGDPVVDAAVDDRHILDGLVPLGEHFIACSAGTTRVSMRRWQSLQSACCHSLIDG
jgi:hypothetical protein